MRKWLAIFLALLVVTGYVLQFAFHLMNLPRDDAYIGGICLATVWFLILLTVGKYACKQFAASLKEAKAIVDQKEKQKANEKQSSAASTPVEPTGTNDRMHN